MLVKIFYLKNLCNISLLLFWASITLAQGPPVQDSIEQFPVPASFKFIENPIEALSQYIQLKSVTGNEIIAGEFLYQLAQSSGLHMKMYSEERDQYNFIASLYPLSSAKPNIIFLNHIDVVEANNPEAWTHPPFSGHIDDTYVWGRGAYDNKGAAITQLYALLKFKSAHQAEDLPFNVSFLSVSGEETQNAKGASFVIENHFEELHAELVLGEGPGGVPDILISNPDQVVFGISVAHKKALWLKLKIDNHTHGHGSVTPESYATQELIHALDNLTSFKHPIELNEINSKTLKGLGRLDKSLQGFVLRHINFFSKIFPKLILADPVARSLLTNSMTVTNISSGNAVMNKIPSKVEAILDCRLLPNTDSDQFIRQLKKILDNDEIKIEVLRETGDAIISSTQSSYYNDLEKSLLEKYPDAKVIPVLIPVTTDSNKFREKSVLTYSVNPFEITREELSSVHAVDERIRINSILNGIDSFYIYLNNIKKTKSAQATN